MALQWREIHSAEGELGKFKVEHIGNKFQAKHPWGQILGDFDSLEKAKKACEEAPQPQETAAETKHHEPPKHDPPPRTTRR